MVDTLRCDTDPAETPGLPYRLELWSPAGDRIESTLATLRSPTLGYACYYGALREYAGRRIVLRLEDRVIASSAPG